MSGSGKRLLLVDDDRLILATMTEGLRSERYDVDAFGDTEEAINAIELNRYDLAILDMRMPRMSGVELARCIKTRCDLPFIFLSAYSERETVASALAEGALGYAIKPIDLPQMVPTIEAALARANDLRALTEAKSQLQTALTLGRKTSTAVGILMERNGLGYEEAFQALRSAARAKGIKMEDLSSQMVDALGMLNTLVPHRGRH